LGYPIEYTLPEESEGHHFFLLYGNSYLVENGWNRNLIERIAKSKLLMDNEGRKIKDVGKIIDLDLFNGVKNTLEKLGILFIDDQFLRQEMPKDGMRQYLVQFHFYHWLYDGVACLDSIAILLNTKYNVFVNPKHVRMGGPFVEKIKKKDERIANLMEPELVWIEKIKDEMRNLIMHREGRNITGGGAGNESCVVVDFMRGFDRKIELNRIRIETIIGEYLPKIESLTKRTLEYLFPE